MGAAHHNAWKWQEGQNSCGAPTKRGCVNSGHSGGKFQGGGVDAHSYQMEHANMCQRWGKMIVSDQDKSMAMLLCLLQAIQESSHWKLSQRHWRQIFETRSNGKQGCQRRRGYGHSTRGDRSPWL